MREVVIDTETTGLDPKTGDRIVEIGCVELINHLPTGKHYHQYLNPERDMPQEAFDVHGLSEDFLAEYPVFAEIVDDFLAFLGDSRLVIHNASFDLMFVNAELERVHRPPIALSCTLDTLALARRRFPGAQANLDALCKRFNVDRSARAKHGALLDSELLAQVYLELIGGRQHGLALVSKTDPQDATAQGESMPRSLRPVGPLRPPRQHAPSEKELAAHNALLEKLQAPLWRA